VSQCELLLLLYHCYLAPAALLLPLGCCLLWWWLRAVLRFWQMQSGKQAGKHLVHLTLSHLPHTPLHLLHTAAQPSPAF